MTETGLDPEQLIPMVGGYRHAAALIAATRLGVPDALAHGPLDSAELAARCGCHEPSLRRLMRYLVALDAFTVDAGGRFALTPFSRPLCGDEPGSQRDFVLGWAGFDGNYTGFGHLADAVRTGRTGFELAFGAPFFERLEHDTDMLREYEAANNATIEAFQAFVDAYDYTGMQRVVDVGGGQGGFLLCLLARYPEIRGVCFDVPHVIASAEHRLDGHALRPRLDLVGGDMCESVPPGADVYFFCTVLRCVEDAACVRALRNCRHAMAPGGRVLVCDLVIPDGAPELITARADVVNMVLYGGHERTEAEWSALFEEAGLRLRAILPGDETFPLIEGVAAP